MKVLVCCLDKEKPVFSAASKEVEILYTQDLSTFDNNEFDAVIDLLFQNSKERKDRLKIIADLVIVNSVVEILEEIDPSFIRINGWPEFLKASVVEASALDERQKAKANLLFNYFDKQVQWLDDEPGFISARVISMIINEAYFALAEGVSTREDIDTAMKLGTAYPHGPFEWARLIGLAKVAELLTALSGQSPGYRPAPLLVQEARS